MNLEQWSCYSSAAQETEGHRGHIPLNWSACQRQWSARQAGCSGILQAELGAITGLPEAQVELVRTYTPYVPMAVLGTPTAHGTGTSVSIQLAGMRYVGRAVLRVARVSCCVGLCRAVGYPMERSEI